MGSYCAVEMSAGVIHFITNLLILPNFHRSLAAARVYVAARRTTAKRGIVIIRVHCAVQIGLQVDDLHLDAMDTRVALIAEPLERVDDARRALAFNDQAQSVRRALWRMQHARWEQKNFAFANWHIPTLAVVDDPERDIALELVKELLQGIVVIVGAIVWPTNHRHDEIRVLPNCFATGRWHEILPMVFNPFFEIEGKGQSHCGSPNPLGTIAMLSVDHAMYNQKMVYAMQDATE